MKNVHYYTYWGYSVAAFLVWGMVLVNFWAQGNATTIQSLLLVFLGWAIAWLSTSIARIVYPPPKRWFNLKTQSWSALTGRETS